MACLVCVLQRCFPLPLISHLLCLDYYFGRRPKQRRCINICSQFALWLRSHVVVLCLDVSVISVPLLCNTHYHIISQGLKWVEKYSIWQVTALKIK